MLRRTALTFLLALSTTAMAHSELPSAQWCETGRPTEVASFRLEAAAIRSQTDAVCSNESGAKTCGQFDDDYSRTMHAAQRFCGQFAQLDPERAVDIGSTSPLISGPRSFLSSDHHLRFRLQLGVEGVCLRCEPARPAAIESRTP